MQRRREEFEECGERSSGGARTGSQARRSVFMGNSDPSTYD